MIDPADAAARARAAIAYADIRHRDVAAQTGINIETLRRITSAKNARGATIDELWAIGDATGAPRDFMLHGMDVFDPHKPAGQIRLMWNRILKNLESLVELGHRHGEQLQQQSQELRELSDRVAALEVRAAESPPGLPDPGHQHPPHTSGRDSAAGPVRSSRTRKQAAG